MLTQVMRGGHLVWVDTRYDPEHGGDPERLAYELNLDPLPGQVQTMADGWATVWPAAYGNDPGDDDAGPINVALRMSQVKGVRLMPGAQYNINTTISVPGFTTIDGGVAGEFSPARLTMAAGANLNAVMASQGWVSSANTSSTPPVFLRNIQIEANAANQSGGAGHGLVLQSFAARVYDVTVRDTLGDGIRFDFFGANGSTQIGNTAVENKVVGCKIINAGSIGINSTDPASTSSFTDGFINRCIVNGAANDAIRLTGSAGWLLDGCHVYGMQKDGIHVERPFNTRVVNNYVETFGLSSTQGFYAGIQCLNAQLTEGIIINNNAIEIIAPPGNASSTLRGIDFEVNAANLTSAATIIGNSMYCNQTGGATAYQGIFIQGAAGATVDFVHTGNSINGNFTAGVVKNPNGGTINDNGAGN